MIERLPKYLKPATGFLFLFLFGLILGLLFSRVVLEIASRPALPPPSPHQAPSAILGEKNESLNLSSPSYYYSAGPNLLANPSFEAGNNLAAPAGWGYISDSTVGNTSVLGESVRTGNLSLRLEDKGCYLRSKPSCDLGISQPKTETINGRAYILSLYVRTRDLVGNPTLRIGFFGQGSKKDPNYQGSGWEEYSKDRYQDFSLTREATKDWKRHFFVSQNLALGKYPLVQIKNYQGGIIYFEDLSLNEIEVSQAEAQVQGAGSVLGLTTIRHNPIFPPIFSQEGSQVGEGTIKSETGSLYPASGFGGSLGTADNRFSALYLSGASISDKNFSLEGTATIKGDTTTGNLDASGTLKAGTSDAFSVDASGNITAGTWQGTTIGVAYGGTGGTTTPTAGAIAYGTGTSYAFSTAGSSNQLLISQGTAAPSWTNLASLLTAGTNISISGTTNATIATINNPAFSTSVTTPLLANAGALTIQTTATAGADDLIFQTAGTEKMRILENGNVGIGTTSPGYTLDIASTAQMTGFKMPTGASAGYVLTSDALGVGTWSVLPTSAPSNATYITQTENATLTNEQALSLLSTGLMKNTTGTGVVSIAIPGTDYEAPIASGLTTQYFRGDKTWQVLETTVVPEGTNLYYTDARARAALSGTAPITYNSSTGVIGLTTPLATSYGGIGLTSIGTANQILGVNTGATGLEYKNIASLLTAGSNVTLSGTTNVTISASGGLTGTGTTNYLSKWTSATALGNSVIYDDGINVGIGTTGPGYKLDVSGDINFSGKLREDGVEILSGMIAAFVSTCPTGWTEYTAARGRYVVGTPAGGTIAATVGTALTDQENRAVGQHTHTVNDPGHSHGYSDWSEVAGTGDVWNPGTSNYASLVSRTSSSATTGISIDSAGSVAGTNAPYIQLVYCQKSAGADLAEWIPASEDISAETIVSVDPANNEKIIASRKPYDQSVVGIIATKPGWLIGEESPGSIQMALAGRVPTRVSLVNGEINRGDPITTSTIPGVGMRATAAGPIIGKAMEPFNEQSSANDCLDPTTGKTEKCGTIAVFVNVSWYDPTTDRNSQSTFIAKSPFVAENMAVDEEQTTLGDIVNVRYDWQPDEVHSEQLVRRGLVYAGAITDNWSDAATMIGVLGDGSSGEVLQKIRRNGVLISEKSLITNGVTEINIAPTSDQIKQGDFLTLSEIRGKAKKSTKAEPVIAKALENWTPDSGRTKIKAFVQAGYNLQAALRETSNLVASVSSQLASQGDFLQGYSTLSDRLNKLENSFTNQTASVSAELAALKSEIADLKISLLVSPSASLLITNDQSLSTSTATVSGTLTVLGKTILSDLGVTGKLTIGLLTIDGLPPSEPGSQSQIEPGSSGASLSTLAAPLRLQDTALADLEIMGGKLVIDTKGNLKVNEGVIFGNERFRGRVTLKAGETEVRVSPPGWEKAPTTIVLTPSYTVAFSVREISDKGFTIKVEKPSDKEEELHWLAIW